MKYYIAKRTPDPDRIEIVRVVYARKLKRLGKWGAKNGYAGYLLFPASEVI